MRSATATAWAEAEISDDAWKLAHWDDYRPRLFMPAPADYPELTLFDNTGATPAQVDALLADLLGSN